MDIIKMFYDFETTGVNPKLHSVHQIAGVVEINEEIVESFNIRMQPHPKCIMDPGALKKCKVTGEELRALQPMESGFKEYKKILNKYVDKYDKNSKMWNVGFNNRSFDDQFLRIWFGHNNDDFYGSYFWSDSLDVLVLACEYLLQRRRTMPSFQLQRVARELGIVLESHLLHEAEYDVYLTRAIYRIVTGRDMEI